LPDGQAFEPGNRFCADLSPQPAPHGPGHFAPVAPIEDGLYRLTSAVFKRGEKIERRVWQSSWDAESILSELHGDAEKAERDLKFNRPREAWGSGSITTAQIEGVGEGNGEPFDDGSANPAHCHVVVHEKRASLLAACCIVLWEPSDPDWVEAFPHRRSDTPACSD